MWRSEGNLGGPVLSHCSPFNGRGRGGGKKSKAEEESKKGKGDGKRKDTEEGREAEVRASVYFITLLEVFINLLKSHG